MRSRNIKPSLFKNEILGVEDPILTIVFIGLWCAADKEGRLEDRPLRLKAEILPHREGIDFNGYLTVLSRLGFIRRYESSNTKVIEVINFSKHQNPHHTEKVSELPEFTDGCKETVSSPLNTSDTPADSLLLIPDSLIPDSKPLSEKSDAYTESFSSFWSAYPKKTGKGKAFKTWRKNSCAKHLDKILSAISWQIDSPSWREGYIPLPDTYLSQGRWDDEPDLTSRSNQVKTFEQQKMDNTKKAMLDFVIGGDDDGFGQDPVRKING